MFRSLCFALAAVVALFAFDGCGVLAKKKPKPKPTPPAAAGPRSLFVGTVALVNEAQNFVLVDNGMAPSPASGMALKCYSDGKVCAELSTSAMRRHPFVIADIRSGTPHRGDRVFYELPAGAQAPQTTAPSTPAPTSRPAISPGTGLPANSLPPTYLPPVMPPSAADQ